MKAACEVCGAPLRASPNRVEIDGAIMVVCNNCARLGRQVGPVPPAVSVIPNRIMRANPPQIALRTMAQRPTEQEYELDPDYHLLIRQAREKLGLSQDQLGKLI